MKAVTVWSSEPEPEFWQVGESASLAMAAADRVIDEHNVSGPERGMRVTVWRGTATPDPNIAAELENEEMTHAISNIQPVLVEWTGWEWRPVAGASQ